MNRALGLSMCLLMACSPKSTSTLPTEAGPSETQRAACAVFELSRARTEAPIPAYWPSGTFDEDPSLDRFVQAWYASQLCAMGEPRLSAPVAPDQMVVRFLWLRSFDPGIAIRASRAANTHQLSAVQLDGAGGYAPGAVSLREERSLSAAEWDQVSEALTAADYWQLPTSDRSNDGVDGSQWVVEVRDGDNYHVVDRWMGRDIGPIGEVLLELSKLERHPR